MTYQHIALGELPVPAGQKVTVTFNDITSGLYDFSTASLGKYMFQPMSAGNYYLGFVFVDSLLQYNNKLIENEDQENNKDNMKVAVNYVDQDVEKNKVIIGKENQNVVLNYKLTAITTGIQITVTDNAGNPLPNARVCLFANADFAASAAPYCTGCVTYLSTDMKGQVIFAGLTAGRTYYINARTNIGTAQLVNSNEADKVTVSLPNGEVTKKTIQLIGK